MSNHVSEDELKNLVREGKGRVKILSREAPAKAEPPPKTDAEKIIGAIEQLSEQLAGLADRPAPEVKVTAPNVKVEPKIEMPARKPFRKFKVRVTKRDKTAEHRIEELEIEAID